MKLKQTCSTETAAAKTGFSRSTGFRISKDPQSETKNKPQGSRRPDPLDGIFDSRVVPILKNCCIFRLNVNTDSD